MANVEKLVKPVGLCRNIFEVSPEAMAKVRRTELLEKRGLYEIQIAKLRDSAFEIMKKIDDNHALNKVSNVLIESLEKAPASITNKISEIDHQLGEL